MNNTVTSEQQKNPRAGKWPVAIVSWLWIGTLLISVIDQSVNDTSVALVSLAIAVIGTIVVVVHNARVGAILRQEEADRLQRIKEESARRAKLLQEESARQVKLLQEKIAYQNSYQGKLEFTNIIDALMQTYNDFWWFLVNDVNLDNSSAQTVIEPIGFYGCDGDDISPLYYTTWDNNEPLHRLADFLAFKRTPQSEAEDIILRAGDKIMQIVKAHSKMTENVPIRYFTGYIKAQQNEAELAQETAQEAERTAQNPRYISRAVMTEVWKRDGGKCARCGSREGLEFDHIIPVSLGGSSTAANVQLLCKDCNRSKGNREVG